MNRTHRQQGVMLLEALIGILIFSVGILALIGMQATAMRATIDAKYRSEASFLANEVLGQMWVSDKANLAAFATSPGAPATCPGAPVCPWITRVGQLLPNANGANAPEIAVATNEVTVTVTWQPPGDAQPSRHVSVTQINGGT